MPFTEIPKNQKAKKIKHEFYSVSFKCGNCHAILQESDNFCSRCGVEFEKDSKENNNRSNQI